MATIDPFTTEGAKQIAQITGQQPAPVSASVLSAPTVPNLPQPAYTPSAVAPPIPSLDDIFATTETPLDKTYQAAIDKEASLEGDLAQKTAYQTQQEQAANITGKKATATSYLNRLNNLKAEADQIPLQLQN